MNKKSWAIQVMEGATVMKPGRISSTNMTARVERLPKCNAHWGDLGPPSM